MTPAEVQAALDAAARVGAGIEWPDRPLYECPTEVANDVCARHRELLDKESPGLPGPCVDADYQAWVDIACADGSWSGLWVKAGRPVGEAIAWRYSWPGSCELPAPVDAGVGLRAEHERQQKADGGDLFAAFGINI